IALAKPGHYRCWCADRFTLLLSSPFVHPLRRGPAREYGSQQQVLHETNRLIAGELGGWRSSTMEFAGANDINGKTGGWVSGRLRINFGGDLIHQNANRKWAKPAMLAITQRQSSSNLVRRSLPTRCKSLG